MANPQPVPFVRFSKELFEAFYLNPPETVAACTLWLWVLRWTWADFAKEETPQRSVRQLAEELGISKTNVGRTLESLVRCRRLKIGKQGGYAIQKDYDLWRKDPKPREDHWATRAQQATLFQGSETLSPTRGHLSPRMGQKRPLVGDKAVPSLGTPIRSKNTVEKGEGARGAQIPPSHLSNGKKDTPRNRAELGHADYPPEDHPDFKRFDFSIQKELTDAWKANMEKERAKNTCKSCKTQPRASDKWPYCRSCTRCRVCSAKPDGKLQFKLYGGEIVCAEHDQDRE